MSITPGDRVMEGRKASLTCESDANPPISEYTWFDWNNQELPYYGQTLSLNPVKVEHSGSYWCKGVNRLGEGASPPSTLTIYCKPPFCFFSGSFLALTAPAAPHPQPSLSLLDHSPYSPLPPSRFLPSAAQLHPLLRGCRLPPLEHSP